MLEKLIEPKNFIIEDNKKYLLEAGHKLDKFSKDYCSLIKSAVVEWSQMVS